MCRPRRSCRLPEREQLASTLRCLHRPLGSTQAECNIEIFKGTDRVECGLPLEFCQLCAESQMELSNTRVPTHDECVLADGEEPNLLFEFHKHVVAGKMWSPLRQLVKRAVCLVSGMFLVLQWNDLSSASRDQTLGLGGW